MKKILPLFFIAFFLSGCSFPWDKTVPSALHVTSIPKAQVFVDGKDMGKSPLKSEKIIPGDHIIRVVAESASYVSWQGKIKFTPQIATVINRVLGPTEVLSSGEIVNMEPLEDSKTAELAVVSSPDGAKVVMDNNDVGLTPFAQKNTNIGEHELVISFPGYTQRLIKVKTRAGYRLIVNVQLAQILTMITPVPDLTEISSSSATISAEVVTPTPSVSGQPERPRIKVLDTSTGWLRVRENPSISGKEMTKIYPGEYYSYIDEQAGWVKIKLDKDREGWISVQFVEKQF